MKDTSHRKRLILYFPKSGSLLGLWFIRLLYNRTPLSIQILAALTPKDYKISIYNQWFFLPRHAFQRGALVGISCATFNAYDAYRTADRFRKAGATVVMGGVHVSQFSDEALQHCDSVVIGEAESVWPGLVKDFEDGSLQKIYKGVPLDDWATSTKDFFLSLKYYRQGPLRFMLGRGCKYCCSFCVPFFGKPRLMRIEQALELIQKGLESRSSNRKLHFLDDNIFADPVYAKALFKALIPLKIKWSASASIDIAFDEEALQLLKESGCFSLFIGIETIYPQEFPKTAVGGMQSSDDLIQAVQKIQLYGIQVMAGIVLGLDHCTHAYCFKLLKFMAVSNFHKFVPAILTPFPGSKVFDQLKSENRILSFDWRQYDPYRVVFKPKHMSALALYLWHNVFMIVGIVPARMRQYMLVNVLAVLLSAGLFLLLVWAVGSLLLSGFLLTVLTIINGFK